MTRDTLLRWIWLTLQTSISSYTPHTLLQHFSTVDAVYSADEAALSEVERLRKTQIPRLLDKSLARAESVLAYCEENGVRVICSEDFAYPKRLKTLLNFPLVLYCYGQKFDLNATPCVSLVGPRKMSDYGEAAAKRIGYDLARSGVLIVSGLAEGIDAVAHKAALYAEGKTVGVLGCGIDRIYPPCNKELFLQMYSHGMVMTEFPPNTPPLSGNFPIRNRIIAALSSTVLVAEAQEDSGALITADIAIRQKRSVFAVPGSIFSEKARGSNDLFRVGVRPCMGYEDITAVLREEYPDDIPLHPRPSIPKKEKKESKRTADYLPSFDRKKRPLVEKRVVRDTGISAKVLEGLSAEEKALYDRLTYEPIAADALVTEERNISRTLRILSALEMKGVVCACPGNRFMREHLS